MRGAYNSSRHLALHPAAHCPSNVLLSTTLNLNLLSGMYLDKRLHCSAGPEGLWCSDVAFNREGGEVGRGGHLDAERLSENAVARCDSRWLYFTDT